MGWVRRAALSELAEWAEAIQLLSQVLHTFLQHQLEHSLCQTALLMMKKSDTVKVWWEFLAVHTDRCESEFTCLETLQQVNSQTDKIASQALSNCLLHIYSKTSVHAAFS